MFDLVRPALEHQGIVLIDEKGNPRPIDKRKPRPLERLLAKTIKGFSEGHPCIGAKRAMANQKTYMSVIPDMTTVESAITLLADFATYCSLTDHGDDVVKTLIVVATGTHVVSQEDYANKHWEFAQLLHDLDGLLCHYDDTVSMDPVSDSFEFSLNSRAVFTTTLNPHSPRVSRRFPYPAWVMNQTSQFNALREAGEFSKWQDKIRKVDAELDPSGTHNLILSDSGYASAFDQLAGSKPSNVGFEPRYTSQERRWALEDVKSRAIMEYAPGEVMDWLDNVGDFAVKEGRVDGS